MARTSFTRYGFHVGQTHSILKRSIGGGAGGRGALAPQTKIWVGTQSSPVLHWCRSMSGYKYKNHAQSFQQNYCQQNAKVVFDITCGIGDLRADIFCLKMIQELSKKNHEAGSSEQLPTHALSQIDYGHTGHYYNCKEVCLCQIGAVRKLATRGAQERRDY